jgi:hypothetical protein
MIAPAASPPRIPAAIWPFSARTCIGAASSNAPNPTPMIVFMM